MVRLYYLAMIHKSEGKNTTLAECFDLFDFSFFRRSGAKEFMRFSSRVLVGRTEPGRKVSVQEQMYVCHVCVRSDDVLAATAVTDDEYPYAAAHRCLQDLLFDFATRRSASDEVKVRDLMELYREPPRDRMGLIQEQLGETEVVLHRTLDSVLRRGENLDDLVAKTDELSLQAKAYYRSARKTNACCHAF